ncbi:MAG: hypothetical protein ACRC3J_05630 [Culicoidibacterales bacterium]
MILQAPKITSLKIAKLAANFAHFMWDDVGANFAYVIEYETQYSRSTWINLGVTYEAEWFADNLNANTKYRFRFATTAIGFKQSEWVYSDPFETFDTNAYSTTQMIPFQPSRVFIDKKLTLNESYVDFNRDSIYATLMDESFVFDAGIANASNVENFILSDREYHEVLSPISKLCTSDDRTYLGFSDKIMYVTERFQTQCRVSDDGGKHWYTMLMFPDRIGYPIARNVFYQNRTTTYALGYDELMQGRSSDDVRFSSETVFWSSISASFVRRVGDGVIPFFPIVFGSYAKYPDSIKRKVEAQAASNKWVYACANDEMHRISVSNAPVEVLPSGEIIRKWEQAIYPITGNPKAVVRKMDVFNELCYALVIGEVKDMADDRHDTKNIVESDVAGLYRFNERYYPEYFVLGSLTYKDEFVDFTNGIDFERNIMTFAPDGTHFERVHSNWYGRKFKGRKHGTVITVMPDMIADQGDSFKFESDADIELLKEDFQYPNAFDEIRNDGDPAPMVPDGGEWVRVFGETLAERRLISVTGSNLSTDGVRVFVSSDKYQHDSTEIDTDLPIHYDEVKEAVKIKTEFSYPSTQRRHLIQVESTDGEVFERRPQQYYNEAAFGWMASFGERYWINHEQCPVLVHPAQQHSYLLDPLREGENAEIWDKGTVTFKLDNISFRRFSQYSGGVLIHKEILRANNSGGQIIGFYEFPYRVRDSIDVIWKPDNVMMIANLQGQTRYDTSSKVPDSGLVDPDLKPLIRTMGPEVYFPDNNDFTKFAECYLQYISEGKDSYYNKLLNLIRDKYPREENAYEYLWSEIRKRNLYLDQEKRDYVTKFFESQASNFYSSKGTIESYKFLFKLLYDADVEIEVESSFGVDYDIVVKSNNISDDLVGRTIYTQTGRANVTYINREYENGKLQWKVTLHNLTGTISKGQVIKSEKTAFVGEVLRGVAGKELAYSDIDYINRNKSYYTMKIKSELNTALYRDDVIRFVHPVGFGFIGITLLTVFINGGLSMVPQQTIVELNKSLRFDAGLPVIWNTEITVQDPASSPLNPEPLFDPVTGELVVRHEPIRDFSVDEWNAADPTDPRDYDADNIDVIWDGTVYKPSERRLIGSPLFDAFSNRFCMFKRMIDTKLKDDLKAPRDPSNYSTHHPDYGKPVSQYKVGE